ncbi:hypothetical protein WR25_20074 [Diploscapter pachys]|uniref:Uncharacterized protein n=1 Tax=Diploscapter pachys TaxID=2018661 RepID=A0A2A2JVX3_9BILA|nr:hypothetical protein WR25_20074 [Diploscapter pachys]
MKAGLAVKLVRGEIEIAIGADRQGIGPADARIADQGRPFAVIEHPDRIMFVITGEDAAPIVLGNAIRRAFAPHAANRAGQCLLGHRWIAQHRRGHGMERAARQRPVIEHAAIGAQRDRVAGDGDRRRGPAGRAVHQHLAVDDRREARLRVGRRVAGQAADRPSAGDVDDDNATDARVAAVGDVSGALLPLPQVEAHVVEIGRRQHDAWGKDDRLDHPVGREVDPYQLCAPGLGRREFRCRRVQHPQAVRAVGDNALHRDEVTRRVGGIRAIGRGVGIGHRLAIDQLGDRERGLVAPLREVDEDAAVGRDGHTGRHRAIEGCDPLDPGSRSRIAGRRPDRDRGDGSGGE